MPEEFEVARTESHFRVYKVMANSYVEAAAKVSKGGAHIISVQEDPHPEVGDPVEWQVANIEKKQHTGRMKGSKDILIVDEVNPNVPNFFYMTTSAFRKAVKEAVAKLLD